MYCVVPCDPTHDACPATFSCVETTAVNAGVCFPGADSGGGACGGCSNTGSSSGGFLLCRHRLGDQIFRSPIANRFEGKSFEGRHAVARGAIRHGNLSVEYLAETRHADPKIVVTMRHGPEQLR
jgi:hypothetical protein